MTTIVVDQEMGYMAADRQAVSNDGDVIIECPKLLEIEVPEGTCLVASSGNEGPATIVEKWIAEGDWDNPLDPWQSLDTEDEFTTLLLMPDCELWVIDKFCIPYRVKSRWYGTGTGGPFAWAILEAGLGIDKAMTTAIKMDPNSGLGYDILYLHELNE